MGSDTTPARFMGLAVPMDLDEGNVWTGQSSYTEQTPQPGDVAPEELQQRLDLRGSGSLTTSSAYNLRIQAAGVPGTSAPPAVAWKKSTDGASDYRGHEEVTLAAWRALSWVDTSGTPTGATEAINPQILALPDGRAVVVYQRRLLIFGVQTWSVVLKVQALDGSWSGSTAIYSTQTQPVDGMHPTLCLEPSGDGLLCAHFVEDGSDGQVRMHRAKLEDLSSWTTVSTAALADALNVGTGSAQVRLRGLRLVARPGQFLLVARLFSNTAGADPAELLYQWASVGGLRYTLVDHTGAGDALYMGPFDLVELDRVFVLVYLDYSGGLKMRARRVASAYESLKAAPVVEIDTGHGTMISTVPPVFGVVALAATAGDTGRLWVSALDGSGRVSLWMSRDGGLSWTVGRRWYDSGDQSTVPLNLSICQSRGRFLVAHNWTADPGDEDNSLAVAQLGGWSQVVLNEQAHTWIPLDLPSDTTWDGYGTGAGVLDAGCLDIDLTSATAYYDRATNPPTNTTAKGVVFRFTVHPIQGGDNTTNKIFFRVQNGPNTGFYELTIRFSVQALAMYIVDTAGGVALASVSVSSWTDPIQVVGHLGEGVAAVWYRQGSLDALASEDRTWSKVTLSAAPTITTSGSAFYNNVAFGQEIGGSSPKVASRWYDVAYGGGSTSSPLHSMSNPADLPGAEVGTVGREGYINGGLHVAGQGGPGREGDSYTATPRHAYPVHRTIPRVSSSGQTLWRSAAVASGAVPAQTISYAVSSDTMGAEEEGSSDLIALVGIRTNFRQVNVKRRDTISLSWVTLATVDLAVDWTSTGATRKGRTLHPGAPAAPAVAQWVAYNDLAGWIAEIDAGGTVYRRRVLGNTAGVMSNSSTSKRAALTLDGVTGAEPTSGITVRLYPREWTLLISLNGETASGYQIEIPAQETIDSDIRAAGLWLCNVFAFGWPHSWGRIITPDYGVERRERFDGQSVARAVAPVRRSFRFAWTDGADMRPLDDGSADPDYYTASADGSALPVAVADDVAWSFQGLLRALRGSLVPVVYLDKIERMPAGTSTQLITGRRRMIAAELTQAGQVDHVQGDEGVDEVVRVASVIGKEIDIED